MTSNHSRRTFLTGAGALSGSLFLPSDLCAADAKAPADDPAADLDLAWTMGLKWSAVLDITTLDGGGKYWDKRLAKAQEELSKSGGGVVYFPPGSYSFENHIKLKSGVILRGATPRVTWT